MAWECVMFGKYPTRMDSAASALGIKKVAEVILRKRKFRITYDVAGKCVANHQNFISYYAKKG